MNPLEAFTKNDQMRESVFAYLYSTLDSLTLQKIYARGEAVGSKEAKEALAQAKKKLMDDFLHKDKKQIRNAK